MPQLPIADKATLDAVNAKAGANTDPAGNTTLFARLKQIYDYLTGNLGSNASTASATGDIHAKLKDLKNQTTQILDATNLTAIYPSDVVQLSAPTERATTSTTEVVLKAFCIRGYKGGARVKCDLKYTGASFCNSVYIYKNGIKTTPNLYNDPYQLYYTTTADIEVSGGDVIELRAKAYTHGLTQYVKNATIGFTLFPGDNID